MERRHFLTTGSAILAGLASSYALPVGKQQQHGTLSKEQKIKQVVASWCFMRQGPRWSIDDFCKIVSSLGLSGVELVRPANWNVLKKYNLICAATPSHGFVKGMNNPIHWDECFSELEKSIEANFVYGFPNVMTFTGFYDTTHEGGSRVDLEEGIQNCVEGYKKIVGLAEKKGVTILLEPLNTRDETPMKGHPGYMGNHVDICMEIIRGVSSPSLKLLFDVYHIQIMDGDLIRRMLELKEYIGHVQIAGNPGRGALLNTQEINYHALMETLVQVGYEGYVSHEWIPTGNALEELKASIEVCNV